MPLRARLFHITAFALLFVCGSNSIIQLIDVGPLFNFERDEASVRNISLFIDRALKSHGVFLAYNKDWEYSSSASKFAAAQTLFNLPLQEKMEVALGQSNWLRGYLKIGSESGLDSVFEPKEGYAYGYNWGTAGAKSKVNEMQVDNIWPTNLDEISRETLNGVYSDDVGLAEYLSALIFERLTSDLGSNALKGFVEGGESISLMRLFHYLPANKTFIPRDRHILGSSPHTDWGYLTLILQDDCGGLQFLREEVWVDIPAVPGTMVVNAGDYLALLSKGRYRSPIHRVVSPLERERLSFVFFYYPGFDSILPTMQVETEVPVTGEGTKYNTLLSGENLNVDTHKGQDMRFGPYIVLKWREVLRSYS